MSHEIGPSSLEFPNLPVVDWDILWPCREIVPEILDELQLLRRTQIENRRSIFWHRKILRPVCLLPITIDLSETGRASDIPPTPRHFHHNGNLLSFSRFHGLSYAF